MSGRNVNTFPLPPHQRAKLTSAGFQTVEEVLELKPSELSQELDVSNEEALAILQTIRGSKSFASLDGGRTALDLLRDDSMQQYIVTFSERVDELLGGGVPLTKVTELCGAPGVGKTQFCMQLCVDVQIPQCFGGVGGEAVCIDTEGSFIAERLQDMAQYAVQHCQHIASEEGTEEQLGALTSFTDRSILSKIHCFRCHDYVELLAVVQLLPDFIKEHPKVALIVVDSIAFHFRHDFEDMALRTRILNGLAQSFIRLATQQKLAVVLTNQMTTKLSSDRGGGPHLVPALGESWGHAATIRIILFWDNKRRYARLYKHPAKPEAVVPYQVTVGGIRDVCVENMTTSIAAESDQSQVNKRKKMES